MATFSTDVGVEPAYIDFIDIGAGYGVLSVPVDGFFPGDVVQLAALSIAPFAGGPAVITGSVDMVQRTAGFLEYTSATSISAHFTLTAANIATIAAGAFQYSVTVSVLRNGVTETRQVQIGNIAARTSLTPPSPLIVADIVMSGGPVSGGIGTTAPLTAVAYDALGNVIPTAVITWSSSNPLVAQPDQSGLVSFLLPGSTTIIAASMGVQATTTATANDPAFVAPSNKQVAGWLTSDAAWLPHSLDASWIAPGTFAAGGGAPFIFPNPVQATSFAGDGSALTNLAAAAVAGVLPVAHGGTGVASLAAGNLLVGAGTGAMTALAPGAVAGFVRSDGTTWTRAAIVAADVSDLTTAATGITKLGTVNTGTWQGGSIATTYTDAKIKTVTGTLNRLTVGGTSTDPTFDVSISYAGQATITTLGTVATGTWQGSVIATAYTAAKVATVTGTLNRLTIGGTATDPTFDIAATYVGQTSIVTLGTVTTGTWNASVISTTYTSAQLIDLTGTSSRIVIGGTSTHPTVDISGAYIGQGSITTLGTITSGVWNGTAIADAYLAALSASKLTGTTLPASIVTSSLTTVGTIGTGTWQGSAIANAYLASGIDVAKLTTGTTLPSNVVTSSLTTVGVIGSGTWQGAVLSSTYGGTGVNNAGATITLGGNLVHAGAFSTTITVTGTTSVTLPTSGTLVNSAVTTLSSLVSVGTITTGTWNATPIANAYIASGLDVTKLTAGATLPGNVTGSSLTSVGTIGTGVWQGSSIATTYTDAKVKTVAGTVNRLTIGGTATDPTFDVSAAYVGQATITTVGTITTGTWAGTTIGTPNGGTGLTGYTLGDLIYALNTNALAKLAGNTTVTQKFLSMTGDGVNAAAPSWQAISITTLPSLTLTGTLTSTLGTVTASTPWLSSTASWNNAGVTFTHQLVNVFDSASAAGSLLADWQVGSVSQWKVSKGGAVTQAGALTVSAGGLTVTGNSTITGTLGGLTGVTVASGGITVTGNSTITGTLGGLTGLTVASGGLTVTAGTTAVQALTATTLGMTGALTGATTGAFSSSVTVGSTLSIGSTVAASGILRLPNNQAINSRNAANSSDVGIAFIDGSNVATYGSSAASISLAAATAVTGTLSSSSTLTVAAGGISVTSGSITLAANGAEINATFGGVTTMHYKVDASGGLILVDGSNAIRLRTNSVDRLTVSGAGLVTLANGLTVSASGASITGNSSVTGTFQSSSTLTVTAGGISITGNSTISGTLGSLTGLTVASGGASISGGALLPGSGGSLAGTGFLRFGDSNSGGSRDWAIANGASATGVSQIGVLTFNISTALSGDPLAAGTEIMRLLAGGMTLTTGTFTVSNGTSSSLAAQFTNSDGTNGYGVKINASGTSATRYALRINNVADNATFFTVNTTTGSVGFVGIGTSAPDTLFHVAGASHLAGTTTVTGSLTASGAFGCNGATAQTAFASGGAAPAGGTGATAGAYDTAAHRDAMITLVNNMRTALVNVGLMS
jgi:hypothetical protein